MALDERDEFQEADQMAGEAVAVLMPPQQQTGVAKTVGYVEYRNQLVERYHQGARGLTERLRASGREDAEALVVALIDEVIKETDHLLGNELVATENGELRDASVISFKRSEVLEKAIKAVQTKQMFERESGIDIDSPAMMLIFRFFMAKVRATFVGINAPDEMSDLFFDKLSDAMSDWKKELRRQFDDLKGKK